MSNEKEPTELRLTPSMRKKIRQANNRHAQQQARAKAEATELLKRMPPLERDEEIRRITNAIMEHLGECNLEAGLTVLCGIGGQLVAQLSKGNLSNVKTMSRDLAENICRAGYTKLIHEQGLKNNGDGK